MKSVYRKFTDRIAADASRPTGTLPRSSEFAWLIGDWTWNGRPARFAAATYGISLKNEPFLIHNTEADMWVLVLADPGAFGILLGRGIRHGEARFSGDVTIAGKSVRLRQTWRFDREFTVEIENERYSDGVWKISEGELLERVMPPN